MSERFDLAVIGGGPAGTAAAITAARRGQSVILLERGHFPRHKVCGEFVSAESLKLLSDLLQGSPMTGLLASAPRVHHTRVFLPSGGFEAPIDPPAASIARYDLDLALWKAASACTDTRQGCGLYTVKPAARGFDLTGGGPALTCGRVIFAAGRRTDRVAPPHPLVGLKAHFLAKQPVDSVDLYFGKDGYCGMTPLANGLVNVCALVSADAVKQAGSDRMRAAFSVHENLRRLNWEQVTDTVATAALAFAEPEPVRDGIACAGDAAGFIDPFVGDGISLALQSGELAGRIDDAREYAAEYRRRFLPVFRRAARLRKLLTAPAALQKPALFLMKWPGIAAAVVERTRASARNACSLGRD
jgi:flavin-dependent dehydrogenase